jgi:threonine/homoserine/homoserine lactone efflux protein
MPDTAHLTAFLAAAVVLAAIPGPGMLYVLARTLAHGRGAGLRSTLGTAAGGLGHVVAAAVGLSALLMTSALAFSAVKYAGAVYLIWLGVRTLAGLRDPAEEVRGDGTQPPSAAGTGGPAFRQGVLTELLNPKTALFFLTFLPQFVQPDNGPVAVQLLALGCVSVALNSSADVVVAALGGRLRTALSPRWWRRQRLASGCTLIALGGFAAAGNRD